MPTAQFSVTIRSRESGSNEALAEAGRYLGYADQTDIFGYHGDITETSVHLDERVWYVTIEFESVIPSQDELRKWRQEMKALARVEDYECISNPIEP